MFAAVLGGFTVVTTSRTSSYALAVNTLPLDAFEVTSVAICVHVVPPFEDPNITADVTSDVRVYDCGRNGSGNRSCTHSPAAPEVVVLPT